MYYGFVVLSKIIFWLKKKQKQKREEKDVSQENSP